MLLFALKTIKKVYIGDITYCAREKMTEQPTTEIVYAERVQLDKIVGLDPISAAGFTPTLPARLKTLNDALVKSWDGSPIKFIDVVLHPDALYPPTPIIRTEYESSKKVTLRIIPPSDGISEKRAARAYFEIGEGGSFGFLSIVKLEDLQAFIRELVPNAKAYLTWGPQTTLEKELPKEKIIFVDFLALTQTEYNQLPTKQYMLLVRDHQPKPIFLVGPYGLDRYAACQISNFRFSGTGQEVERAMDLVARLLEFKNCATQKDLRAARR